MAITINLPKTAKEVKPILAEEPAIKQEVKKPVEVATEQTIKVKELDNG